MSGYCGVGFDDKELINPEWFSRAFPRKTVGQYTLSIAKVTHGYKVLVGFGVDEVIVHHLWDKGELARFCSLTDIRIND